MKVDWLWLIAGIVLALFVLPMVRGFVSSRTASKTA